MKTPLDNSSWLIFQGIEDILQGIAIPLIIAVCACIMRIAMVGWHGVRHFFANFCVAVLMGVLAYWVLTSYGLNPNVVAALTCACSLLAKDFLDMLMSERVRHAIRERLIYEIRYYRRRGPDAQPAEGQRQERNKELADE